MSLTVTEFLEEWNSEMETTQRLFDALTDASLHQEVTPDDRTLGRIAWHIVESIPTSIFGLNERFVQDPAIVPTSAKKIADSFRNLVVAINQNVQTQWSDSTLKEIHQVFGREMPLEVSLPIILKHLIHHRGQLTVLIRQAGIKVPSVYGPAREDWAAMGMEVPQI
ncbi:DinB family protein [Bacillus sp. B1-b2]|uniref:DinB family protein n=1 Tax=Bacillus sp. B1-b2 TaxID=2653201 RepID=UPI00126236AE|nr:DinB family protein [Bacillus sp. B1-b2]KAB7667186.1 hypothetical protein F9279_16475 [Bacillus sp. B1-b2]